jgi:hypothetical protein
MPARAVEHLLGRRHPLPYHHRQRHLKKFALVGIELDDESIHTATMLFGEGKKAGFTL